MSTQDSMVEVYVYENSQLLEQLEEMLIASEKGDKLTKAQIDEIFRVMHTIKGSSAMMGYDGLTKLSHGMEDMFSALRQNPETPKEAWEMIFDLVLECIDFFKGEIAKIQEGLVPDGSMDNLHQRSVDLMAIVNGSPASAPAAQAPAAPAATAPAAQASAPVIPAAPVPAAAPAAQSSDSPSALRVYRARIHFDMGCSMESVRAFAVVRALDGMFTRLVSDPADLSLNSDEYIISNGLGLYIETNEAGEDIRQKLEETMFLNSLEFNEVLEPKQIQAVFSKQSATPRAAAPAAAQASAPVQPSAVTQAPKNADAASQTSASAPEAKEAKDDAVNAGKNLTQNYLSVNVHKVDKLMDLVGEIVTTESMVTQLPDESTDFDVETFDKQARRLRQLTDELQDTVMSIRMVPISSTFRKMQRIVRDMSRKMGKEAELVLLGETTEVDKNVNDNLSDPLMHMIRNSMDHGLESAEERIAKGKNPVGRITLEARNTGGDVIIIVSDDGRGLDRAKLIKKAQDKGLTAKTDAEISDREAYNFILAPGFSTKEAITEFSGRGVGMDVVSNAIEKLGGTLSIDSTPGEGMTCMLHIPLTLAIIKGMDVQVGTEHFIIPILNMKESFEPKLYEQVTEPGGLETIMIRGKSYPIKRLHNMFKIPTEVTDIKKEGIMVLVESEFGSSCLFVDKIVGEQQAVIKPIPLFISKMVGRLKNISGCTVLGNGSVSLILDVNGLCEKGA